MCNLITQSHMNVTHYYVVLFCLLSSHVQMCDDLFLFHSFPITIIILDLTPYLTILLVSFNYPPSSSYISPSLLLRSSESPINFLLVS